jgi:uncharacterized protein YggU (UPF0235/DUF167 family)
MGQKIVQEREKKMIKEIILTPKTKVNKLRHIHDKLQRVNVKLLQSK